MIPRRATLAAWVFSLLLSGCAAELAPIGTVSTEPRLSTDGIETPDGAYLPLRASMPDAAPKAVILALHGFNDYSRAFDDPGAYLAKKGIATYAYDQRGFGEAPRPGRWFGAKVMAEDARTAARLIRARHPGVPLFLMGESMGGAVALVTATTTEERLFDGTILIAPAVWGRVTMGPVQQAALWFFSNTMAWFPVSGQGFDIQPSDNDAMLRLLSADPLVLKGSRIGTIAGLIDLMDDALAAVPSLTGPALFVFGDRDEVIPPGPTCRALSRLAARPPAQWRAAFYPKGYHMLLRDIGGETVMDDIAAWIADQSGGLPSGAEVLRDRQEASPEAIKRIWFCRHFTPPA